MHLQTILVLLVSASVPWLHVQGKNNHGYNGASELLQQMLLNENLLETMRLVSPVGCARMCNHIIKCFGYKCDYHLTTKMCQISSHTGIVIIFGNSSAATRSTEAPVCGAKPEFPNAKTETKTYSTGAVVTYTCNSDFIPCPKKLTKGVCQTTGQWANVTGLCERFRWKNHTLGVSCPIPCGQTKKLTVTFRIIPTKKTKFTVHFRTGLDAPFIAEFRLHVKNNRNVIVFNSLIQGKWHRETRLHCSMRPGKEIRGVMNFRRGYYKLKVNGRSKRYKSPRPVLYPEYFEALGDIVVKKIEINRGKRSKRIRQ